MTDELDRNILTAVRTVRRFLEDVGKLLNTANERLQSEGWKGRNPSLIYTSTSIYEPTRWMPQDAFWFSVNAAYPQHLCVVSVLFDSIQSPSLFLQPLIMTGYFRFVETAGNNWSYEWARLAEKTTPPLDGAFRDVPINLLDKAGIVRGAIATNRLTSVTSSDLLNKNIIDPLLAEIAKDRASHGPPKD